MKKFLTIVLSLFVGFFMVVPSFFSCLKFTNDFAEASDFSEETLSYVVDIVPTEKSEMTSSLSSLAKIGETPFDTSTSSPMSGASVEPNTTGSYSEINSTYRVNEFYITSNLSIYMWIFFPDTNYYSLTIKFTSSEGSYFSWTFSLAKISSLISEGGAYVEQYGWKLFEFNLADAEISSLNIYNESFSSMYISYEMEEELDLLKKTSSNSFAFYHVYAASKTNSQTTVVKVQNYSYYSLSDDFTSKFSNLLIDDTMTFGTFESMFTYIYVAKFDLKKSTNTLYTWSGSITPSGSSSQEIYNGQTVTFDSSGWCSVKITMSEYRSNGSITVLSYSTSVYVDNFVLGSFIKSSYEINEGETIGINFQLSNFFVLDGDVVVSVSDKSIASVSYYIIDNICYITLTGESEGKITLTVTANGGKEGGEVSTYSSSVTIEVEAQESSYFTTIFLWATLIVYLIGIVIYAIITIVRVKSTKVR